MLWPAIINIPPIMYMPFLSFGENLIRIADFYL